MSTAQARKLLARGEFRLAEQLLEHNAASVEDVAEQLATVILRCWNSEGTLQHLRTAALVAAMTGLDKATGIATQAAFHDLRKGTRLMAKHISESVTDELTAVSGSTLSRIAARLTTFAAKHLHAD